MIKFIAHDSFKFLGWEVYHRLGETDQETAVRETFLEHMELVDNSNVHGFMKLWLYQHYVVAYLAWSLMIYNFVPWVQELKRIANWFLKLWAGVHARAAKSILYK